MSLEAFQSGLSWRTILRKRPAFRAAFADFDPEAVAAFGDADVERLLAMRGSSATARRSRRRSPTRARPWRCAPPASRSRQVIRAHAPRRASRPSSWADVPAKTPETVALARELKRRGFRFVGPTTLYALMQACGLVDDHLAGCPARPAVERARHAAGLA